MVLFSAIGFTNLFNYIYRFYVGRSLGPGDFGTFETLLSLVYLIVIPLMAIQTSVSKSIAEFKVRGEEEKISYLYSSIVKKMIWVALGFGVLFLVITPFLSSFMKINQWSPFIIIAAFMIFNFLVPVMRGFLQGLQRFKLLGGTFLSEGSSKILFGIPLIYFGLGVSGAVGGFLLGFLFPVLLVVIFSRKLFSKVKEKFDTRPIYRYSFPVLIMLISLTAIYTLDLVLVKRFFSPIDTGYYAALSLFGKVIFFMTMSISMVMFPKISELNAQNKDAKHLLFKSLLIALGIGLFGSFFYFVMPKFILNLLFGNEYLIVAPLLGFFGIIMTIFSLAYVVSFYNIALNRTKFLYLLGFFNLLEILLLSLFHTNIFQVLTMLMIVMALLFFSLVIYTLKSEKSTRA